MSDNDLQVFIDQCVKEPSTAVQSLITFAQTVDPSGTHASERLMDRLRAEARGDALSMQQRKAIILVLSNAVDAIHKTVGPATLFGFSQYEVSRWTTRDLLRSMSVRNRISSITDAVAEGDAVSWLAYFLRSELSRLNKEQGAVDKEQGLFSKGALDVLSSSLLERIKSYAGDNKLLQLEPITHPLLLWYDVDESKEELHQAIKNATSNDVDFLRFILSLKHVVRSTAGNYERIDNELLGKFYNTEQVLDRLQKIKSKADSALVNDAEKALEYLSRDF